MILVIAEQKDGRLNRASWEAVAAAQQLAGRPHAGEGGRARQWRGRRRRRAGGGRRRRSAGRRRRRARDLHAGCLRGRPPPAVVAEQAPQYVCCAHTYQTRDFVADAGGPARPRAGHRRHRDQDRGRPDGVRAADVPGQAGRRRRAARPGAAPGVRCRSAPSAPTPCSRRGQAGATGRPPAARRVVDAGAMRQRPRRRSRRPRRRSISRRPSASSPSGAASRRRRTWRVAEQLAQAFGAELAASRPICDNGWLPMERQIGSSGQTVAPKLYVAVGISGAIQHLVGHEGRAHHRRHQQGRRGADLRDRGLRHRRATCSRSRRR